MVVQIQWVQMARESTSIQLCAADGWDGNDNNV